MPTCAASWPRQTGISAQLAGALQRDRLGVEHAGGQHQLVQLDHVGSRSLANAGRSSRTCLPSASRYCRYSISNLAAMVTTRSGVRERGWTSADAEAHKRSNKTALDNRPACCAARYSAAFGGVRMGLVPPVWRGFLSWIRVRSRPQPLPCAFHENVTEQHERQPARPRSRHPDRPQRPDHLWRLSAPGHAAVGTAAAEPAAASRRDAVHRAASCVASCG